MKHRVVHISRSLDTGGAEVQIVNLVTELRHEFDVSVVCLHEKGSMAGRLEDLGISVEVYRFKTRWSPASLWRLARYLRREGAEVVQSHLYGPNVSGIAAATLAGVPVRIATVHGMEHWGTSRQQRADRWMDRWRQAVLCVSEAVRKMYLENTDCPPGKCRTIPNGVDLSRLQDPRPRTEVLGELGIPSGNKVVGVVARLVGEKNLSLFLEAAAEIRGVREDVSFLIVGYGDQREALERQAGALGLGDAVRFTGLRSDVPDLLGVMDCFLLTSRTEGLPVVLLEAMGSGVPVVATDVGGVGEIIRSREDGFLVPPGDRDGLVSGALAILDHPERAAELQRVGRRWAEEFSIENVARKHADLYRGLLLQASQGKER